MSSLKSKFLYQVSVSLLYSVAPLIIFPYVSRVLGPAAIGKINFIDYASQFFVLLASFGIPYYGAREVARSRNDPKRISAVTSELLGFHILITVVSLLLFLLLIFFRPADFTEKELIILAIINIATNAFGLEWMIHGMEDFKFLAKRSFIIKIASLIAVFIFIKTSSDYLKYYTILIGSNLVILIIDIGYTLKKNVRLSMPFKSFKKHLNPLSIFFLTTVSLSIYTFFDTVILGLISGTFAVGLYTTALKIIRISQNLINDIGGVLLPRVSHLVQQDNKKEIDRVINKSFQYILSVTLPFGLFLFLVSKEIILLLGGEKFLPSSDVLQLLSVLPLILGLSNLFFLQILLPHGKEKIILIGVLLGSVVSIVSNIILCPVYAQKGAAISCIAAEASITCFLGFYSLKEVKLIIPARLVSGLVLSSVLFIPIVLFTRMLSDNYFYVLTVASVLCFAAYLITQLVFRNGIVKESLEFLISKFKRRKTSGYNKMEV